MSLKSRLADLLDYMSAQHLAFAGYLSAADRAAEGTADNWSAKDVVAHSVEWSARRLTDLEHIARGETLPERDYGDFNHENERIFLENRALSWAEVEERAHRTYAGYTTFLALTPDEDLLLTPAEFEQPLWRLIAGNAVSHATFHLRDYLRRHGYEETAGEVFGESFTGRLLALYDDDEWRGAVYYNLACYFALIGETDPAISNLADALRLSPDLLAWSQEDSDLDSLRGEAAYQALYT
jgi:Protein of unknown function (DUF1706)